MDSTIKSAIDLAIHQLENENIATANNIAVIIKIFNYCFGGINTNDWSVDDVIDLAEQNGYLITLDQAESILKTVYKKWDAEYGINWDFIEYWLNDYVENNNNEDI
jgi:hypothetical protein